MMRSMMKFTTGAVMAGLMALPLMAGAQAASGAIIAILPFDNAAFGAGKADYDGLGKGIQDLAIVNLANTNRFRVVDRTNIQKILEEQNLIKAGAIDAQTAVKLGKIMGAHYMIQGTFIVDIKQNTVTLVAHASNVETSQITNPQSVSGKADDIMSLINKLNTQMAADMKLATLGGNAPTTPATGTTKQTGAATKTPPAATKTPPPAATPAASTTIENYALVMPKTQADATATTKLDMKTALLYSKALDALDNKDKKKAADLLAQVLAKAPGFPPALNAQKKATAGH